MVPHEPRDLPCSCLPVLGLQACVTCMPCFPHVCHVCYVWTWQALSQPNHLPGPSFNISIRSPRESSSYFASESWRQVVGRCSWHLIIPELTPIPQLLERAPWPSRTLNFSPALQFFPRAVSEESSWWHSQAHTSQHRPGHSEQAASWWLTQR